LVPPAVAFVAHGSITGATFWQDDFLHLYDMQNGSLLQFLVTPHAGHLYVIRNLVFALSHALFGLRAEGYMWAVLLTHMLNSHLLYRVLCLQTENPSIACAGSTLWAAMYVHRSVIGWYAVYGQVLAGTTLLLSLYLMNTAPPGAVATRRWILCAALLLIGSMCFGVGIALALTFWLVAAIELRDRAQRRRAVAVLSPLVVIVPLLYGLCRWLYQSLSGLPAGETSIAQIVATWRLWVGMTKWLLAHGNVAFASGSVLSLPPDLELAFLWLAGGLCVAVALSKPETWRHFLGWALITLASYAIISIGRAGAWVGIFHSSLQEAAVEPRYHYIGLIGLCGMWCLAAATLRRLPSALRLGAFLLLGAWCTLTLGVNVRSGWQTTPDPSGGLALARVSARIRQQIDAAQGDHVCIPNRAFEAIGEWARWQGARATARCPSPGGRRSS